jgi:hypothetical protein
MVVGESRCDLPSQLGEELTDVEERVRYRPVVEIFEKGIAPSKIFSLPIDEIISLVETDSENLLMIGKVAEGSDENKRAPRVIVSFDGKVVRKLETNAGNAERLVLGPQSAENGTAGPVLPNAESAALDGVWLLDAEALRPAMGDGEPLWLPQNCEGHQAWFIGASAWIVCESGLYTTDEQAGPLSIPVAGDNSTCEVLDPRPDYAVPGIYKKASSAGGCSSRARDPQRKGGPSKRHAIDAVRVDPWDDLAPHAEQPPPSKPSPHLKPEF